MTEPEILNGKPVFWFRRDLRIEDNSGLFHALQNNREVIPVFIFDTNILDDLLPSDTRIEFIHRSLQILQNKLESYDSSLILFQGDPIEIFERAKPAAIYVNHDYEPYAKTRDLQIKKIIEGREGIFNSYKDQVIFEKDEVVKEDGKPFTIYTPYMKKWKKILGDNDLFSCPSEDLFQNFWKTDPKPVPTLEELGFQRTNSRFPEINIDEELIKNYHNTRHYPALHGTSRLSVHLRFGTISIRKLTKKAIELNETFLNELIWRNFFMTILWHFPHVVKQSFKPGYDLIQWENDEEKFMQWCKGTTGFPLIDAGMRELNATGFMHNRVRMITASFLCKDLHIDWRWGEAYFAEKLLDYELASNNGGWQWAAGTGCDAAPYFRIFNPQLQAEKFDPQQEYVKAWVPEVNTPDYPAPIVDHHKSKQKTLQLYKNALIKA